jgi:hypothetical protein
VLSNAARSMHKGKGEGEGEGEGIGYYCSGISLSMSVLSVLSTGLD